MLVNSTVDPGASNRPHVTAAATSHGDTASTAHRRATAPAAATIAATASATCDPAAAGSTGSASSVHSNTVNASRSGPARVRNRRSQPRTVAAQRPNRSATRRCPQPSAARTSAAPTTATVSARRTNTPTGSNTCVHPQPAQRARRGRSRHRTTPSSRTTRTRPCPHGRNRPRHPGHANPPPVSRRSTPSQSLPTVSTGASAHHTAALPDAPPRERPGGPLAYPNPLTLSSHTNKGNPTQARPP